MCYFLSLSQIIIQNYELNNLLNLIFILIQSIFISIVSVILKVLNNLLQLLLIYLLNNFK